MDELKTKLTIDAYDRNAEHYALKFENFSTYTKKILDFHKGYVPEGARIVDLGCGPGHVIKTLMNLDSTCCCTGVDLSTELISIAKLNNPSCTFITEDICTIQLPAEFDVVIASFCIVHLIENEAEKVIESISKCLDKNGHLYLSFMEGSTSGFESTSFSKEQIFFNYYDVDYILELLKKYGIEPQEISREEYLEQDGSITMDIFIFASKQ